MLFLADRRLAVEVCLDAVGGGILLALVRLPLSGTRKARGLLNSALIGVFALAWPRSAKGGAKGKLIVRSTATEGGGGADGGGGSDMTGGRLRSIEI